MKELTLTNTTKVALVSDEDYERVVGAGTWFADFHHGKRVYVKRSFSGTIVYLHNFILGPSASGLDTDHDDGNGLNCQRSNLIRKSRSANNLNNHNLRSDNKTGVRGVYWDATHERWKAEIKLGGKKKHLGSFRNMQDAIASRAKADLEMADRLLKEGHVQ